MARPSHRNSTCVTDPDRKVVCVPVSRTVSRSQNHTLWTEPDSGSPATTEATALSLRALETEYEGSHSATGIATQSVAPGMEPFSCLSFF